MFSILSMPSFGNGKLTSARDEMKGFFLCCVEWRFTPDSDNAKHNRRVVSFRLTCLTKLYMANKVCNLSSRVLKQIYFEGEAVSCISSSKFRINCKCYITRFSNSLPCSRFNVPRTANVEKTRSTSTLATVSADSFGIG